MLLLNYSKLKNKKALLALVTSVSSSIYYLINSDNEDEATVSINLLTKSLSTSSLTYCAYLLQDKKTTSLSLGLGAHSLGDVLIKAYDNSVLLAIPFFMAGHLLYSHQLSKLPFKPIKNIITQNNNDKLWICAFALAINALLLCNVPEMLQLAIPLYTLALLSSYFLEGCLKQQAPGLKIGLLMYIISDSLIAIDKFVATLPKSNYLTWLLYYNAQLLISHALLHATQDLAPKAEKKEVPLKQKLVS